MLRLRLKQQKFTENNDRLDKRTRGKMKSIEKVLNGQADNHLMPFLWMHGEDAETIRDYLRAIKNSGMQEVCLESRPHPAFLQDAWWQELDVIIAQCEKLNMKIWILDDQHFPTGYAAGAVQREHPELRKQFLILDSLDFAGPRKARILTKWLAKGRQDVMSVGTETSTGKKDPENEPDILGVLAARKKDSGGIDENTIRILPWQNGQEVLEWEIPAGEWSLFVLSTTYEGGEKATEGYLNPLRRESTQILIDTVYQAHYDHYGKYFGNVIRGFFSDEPRFGNVKSKNARLGDPSMPLPWVDGLCTDLKMMLLLFAGDGEQASQARYAYMDQVSRLYSENFSGLIGDWCRNHGVEYIGHVVEDNNAHARLGYGAGHFFRSMAGQDMAGLDVVLHQLMPRQNQGFFRSFTSAGWDGEFFTYALARLGASLGDLDPKKKGRTMCEVFGAYGWSEGLSLMKWIADHMLANGITYFVPHAFDMQAFPDTDCPPHFYAHGYNIQYPYMPILSAYMNRFADILSAGIHAPGTAVLYHAEAEWCGEAMYVQKPARVLTENQIDFSIVCADMLYEAKVQDGSFEINQQQFQSLIVPSAARLPKPLQKTLTHLQKNGVQVIFIDTLPEGMTDFPVSSLQALPDCLEKADRIRLESFSPYIRYYHSRQEDGDVLVLFNEDTYEGKRISFPLKNAGEYVLYDPMQNEISRMARGFASPDQMTLYLDRGQTLMLVKGEGKIQAADIRFQPDPQFIWLNTPSLAETSWDLQVVSGFGMPEKKSWHFDQLPDLESLDVFDRFSGTLRYTCQLELEPAAEQPAFLYLPEGREVISVSLNGVPCGTRIASPYVYDLCAAIQPGSNMLEIEVTNTMGRYMQDYLSQFIPEEPLGFGGKILLFPQLNDQRAVQKELSSSIIPLDLPVRQVWEKDRN